MKHWIAVEPLEDRRMLALFFGNDPGTPSEPTEPGGLVGPTGLLPIHVTRRGTLAVSGTDGADRIRIRAGENDVTIDFGGLSQTVRRGQFRRSASKRAAGRIS